MLSHAGHTLLRSARRLLIPLCPLPCPSHDTGGTLARPAKGVLLFGPPGTGKTLVARAAAAECGAAFLTINPSAVASKWFGDSVKFIRQVRPRHTKQQRRHALICTHPRCLLPTQRSLPS